MVIRHIYLDTQQTDPYVGKLQLQFALRVWVNMRENQEQTTELFVQEHIC